MVTHAIQLHSLQMTAQTSFQKKLSDGCQFILYGPLSNLFPSSRLSEYVGLYGARDDMGPEVSGAIAK